MEVPKDYKQQTPAGASIGEPIDADYKDSEHDYQIYSVEHGWMTVEDWNANNTNSKTWSSSDEVDMNTNAGLRWNGKTWAPINSRYTVDGLADQVEQRVKHLEAQQSKLPDADVIEGDEGPSLTSTWINKTIDSIRAEVSDGPMAEFLGMFKTVQGLSGEAVELYNQDPDVQAWFESQTSIEDAVTGLQSKANNLADHIPTTPIRSASTPEDAASIAWIKEQMADVEFTNSVTDLVDAIHGSYSVTGNPAGSYAAEATEATSEMQIELIEKFGFRATDFTDKGLTLTIEAKDHLVMRARWERESEIASLGAGQGDDGSLTILGEEEAETLTEEQAIELVEKQMDLLDVEQFKFMSLSPEARQEEIMRREMAQQKALSQISLENIPMAYWKESIVEQFNEKYGNTFTDWAHLMRSTFGGGLSTNQKMWLMEMHAFAKQRSPQAAVVTTDADKYEEASVRYNKNLYHDSTKSPYANIALGAIDPKTLNALLAAPGRYASFNADWKATEMRYQQQIQTQADQIESRDPGNGRGQAFLDEALDFEYITKALANGEVDFFHPSLRDYQEFAGNVIMEAYMDHQGGSVPRELTTKLNTALSQVAQMGGNWDDQKIGGSVIFLSALLNASIKFGEPEYFDQLIKDQGLDTEVSLVLGMTLRKLALESPGGDIASLDPAFISKIMMASSTDLQAAIAAASAVTKSGVDLKGLVSDSTYKAVTAIHQAMPSGMAPISTEALEALAGGFIDVDRDDAATYRTELNNTQYDEVLMSVRSLIPANVDGSALTLVQIEEGLADALLKTTIGINLLGSDDTKIARQELLGANGTNRMLLKVMLDTPAAVRAFKGSLISMLVAQHEYGHEVTIHSALSLYEGWSRNAAGAVVYSKYDKETGDYTAQRLPVHDDWSHKFTIMPDEASDSNTNTLRSWEGLATLGDDPIENAKRRATILNRNFGKIRLDNGEAIPPDTLTRAQESVDKLLLKRENEFTLDPHDMLDHHLMLIKELAKPKYGLTKQLPQDFKNLAKIFEKWPDKLSLGAIETSLNWGRNPIDRSVAGRRVAPYIEIKLIKEMVDDTGWVWLLGTQEWTSHTETEGILGLSWISLSDEDYADFTPHEIMGAQLDPQFEILTLADYQEVTRIPNADGTPGRYDMSKWKKFVEETSGNTGSRWFKSVEYYYGPRAPRGEGWYPRVLSGNQDLIQVRIKKPDVQMKTNTTH